MFASTSTIAKAGLLPDRIVSQVALQSARTENELLCVKCLSKGTGFFERLTWDRRQQSQCQQVGLQQSELRECQTETCQTCHGEQPQREAGL